VTRAYQAEEDITRQFMNERCEVSNSVGNTPFKDVFADYCKWCEESGYRYLSRNEFSTDLRGHGVVIRNGTFNKVTCFGLSLKVDNKEVRSLDDL